MKPTGIRCKFPVISDLFWVWGKYYQLDQTLTKKIDTGKEKARNTLHVPDNVLEKRVLREVFGSKIRLWGGGGHPLDFSASAESQASSSSLATEEL